MIHMPGTFKIGCTILLIVSFVISHAFASLPICIAFMSAKATFSAPRSWLKPALSHLKIATMAIDFIHSFGSQYLSPTMSIFIHILLSAHSSTLPAAPYAA